MVRVRFDEGYTMTDPVGIAGDRIRSFVERIEQLDTAALPGSLRHPLSGRDPQEGDDDDRDNSFGWGRFGPGWTHVAQTQARCGAAPVAGGRPGDALAGAGSHSRAPDRMAGHLRGGR